jgi:hypothetical protein
MHPTYNEALGNVIGFMIGCMAERNSQNKKIRKIDLNSNQRMYCVG